MIHFKDNKNKSALSTRWAQMTKQEQIIEKKKMEIQAKLEAQKQAAALAAQAKLAKITNSQDEASSSNIFSNDGSFMSQFKALLEKQQKDKKEKEEKEKLAEEEERRKVEVQEENDGNAREEREYREHGERRSGERSRDRHRRWSGGRHRQDSPTTPVTEDRMNENKPIPALMQIPIMPPEEQPSDNQWQNQGPDDDNSNDDGGHNDNNMMQGHMGSGQMGPPGMMGPGPMPPMMGPNMGMGPGGPNMGPGPMGLGGPNMGPGPMGPGGPNMGPGGPNMGPMGPGGPRMMMGPGGPMPPGCPMPPGGPMPPWGPPFMGPNGPMPPPNWGPNGPNRFGPPNSYGPNGSGPNGPMPPFYPPFNNRMMGPNGPNSMMPPNGNMPFNMGPRPPFGPNGPNFGNEGPNMPFIPGNAPPPPEPKQLDTIPPPEPMKLQNIPPPMPLPLNQIPKPNDLDPGNIPAPPNTSQGPIHRAASEVATNGDHWENVLKTHYIHSQDQNMWFLHNPNSNEYKMFRELVQKYRDMKKPEVKPEDKYEPEFCLDEDSNDSYNKNVKEEYNSYSDSNSQNYYNYQNQNPVKREASSQSDEESEVKKERKRKKKSRWGDDPPADVKPPGVINLTVLPGIPGIPVPGTTMPKIAEESLQLTTVNRNNPALMQYAMTNYGTTNLSAEDWKKCEDNYKLNILYQDMLKKRQEVERLAAAGKHKYEYDSDEDITEGTWEHRLRSKEMSATEIWADELTKQAEGKHHIGDFLPPEELKKFMEKYSAAKSGKEPDLSDYKEFKLREDNVGFKMLQKLGWNEGQGLGAEGTGIVDPINKANQPVANLGLGANSSDMVDPDDDEFDAYRKRMMLAYRFRPNPLNNPRRPYY